MCASPIRRGLLRTCKRIDERTNERTKDGRTSERKAKRASIEFSPSRRRKDSAARDSGWIDSVTHDERPHPCGNDGMPTSAHGPSEGSTRRTSDRARAETTNPFVAAGISDSSTRKAAGQRRSTESTNRRMTTASLTKQMIRSRHGFVGREKRLLRCPCDRPVRTRQVAEFEKTVAPHRSRDARRRSRR